MFTVGMLKCKVTGKPMGWGGGGGGGGTCILPVMPFKKRHVSCFMLVS